jgi:hypothetical protein
MEGRRSLASSREEEEEAEEEEGQATEEEEDDEEDEEQATEEQDTKPLAKIILKLNSKLSPFKGINKKRVVVGVFWCVCFHLLCVFAFINHEK